MRIHRICLSVMLALVLACGMLGCNESAEREANPDELVLGNWTQYRNRAYVLLIIQAQGTWNSSVRIADVTSKIVKSKGDASGSWHMDGDQLIFTVMETNIESVWQKNDTKVFDIVELTKDRMQLKEESGWVGEWKKNLPQKAQGPEGDLAPVIAMAPMAVNLNKISSASSDRYLCMSMQIRLKELMPGQEVPMVHPKAREAVLLFLSSLIHDDVQDFERIKLQQAKLVNILNPYMDGVVKAVDIDRVIVASSMDKVETFLIEHDINPPLPAEPEPAAEEGGETEEAPEG